MPHPAFVKPDTLREALAALAATPGCLPMAGGTDVMVMLQARTVRPTALLDLWSLQELKGIRQVDDAIEIGAAESYTQIIESALVQQHLPVLVEASKTIGAAQIQNRGTLGGNLGTASPAGDTLPIMLASDAVVVTDRRTIPVSSFFVGYRETTLDSGELIVAVRFPMDQRRLFFRKVGTRQAQAIAKVVIAVSLEPARIAIGSVAEIPIRARQAEEALERGDRDGAIEAVATAIRPIDDVRSTADYRRRVTRNVLRRILRTGLPS